MTRNATAEVDEKAPSPRRSRRAPEEPVRMGSDSRHEPEVTTADEQVTVTCPSCGRAVEHVIPSGTTVFAATLMRKWTQMWCGPCHEEREEEERAHERRRLRRANEQTCQLPRELRGLTWDTYKTDRRGAAAAMAAAKAWAAGEHTKRGLMLVGDVGLGKTRLAATAAWDALDRRPVTYVNVAELIVKLGASFGDKDRAQALRVLTGKGALVLDDLDKVSPTMTVLSHLYTAIDGRVQSGAPMIVTTNLTPEALEARLARAGRGDDSEQRAVAAKAIVSRLLGHCSVHGLQGEDRRLL